MVARPSDHDAIKKTIADLQLKKCSAIVPGGATRQESVLNGVRAASKETKLFAIHDGARPLVKPEHITAVIHDAEVFGGATLGVPVKDTIISVTNSYFVHVDSSIRFSSSIRAMKISSGLVIFKLV